MPHVYTVHLTAGPDGHAETSMSGVPALSVAAPVEFDGPGDAWTPEHLLLASVEACFLLTLRAVARASKLVFLHLAVETAGTLDRVERVTRFTGITLRARLTVPAGADHDALRRAMDKAERACLISASLSTPVHLDAIVIEQPA